MESTRFHGTNVVSYEVVSTGKRTPLVGSYAPPSTLEHLPDIEEDLSRFRYQYPIVLGDLNTYIGQAQNPRSQQFADMLMDFSLVELIRHLCQCLRFQHLKVRSWVRQVRLLQSRCDYILGT